MSKISDLRDLVRKRRSAVTAKERRIFNNTGVNINNTRDDPRRPPSVIKSYDSRQLSSYLRDLNNFMLRENGYIADTSGGLIPKRDWLSYKRSERKLNKIVKAHFDKIADINDPYRNKTIRQAEGLFVPDDNRAAGEIRHRPYNEIHRDANNIKNVNALKKLHDQVNRKQTKEYLDEALTNGRSQANSMLANAGVGELKNAMAKLSNQQFDVLWNYWGFAGRLAQIGSSGGNRAQNIASRDRLPEQEKDQIKEDVSELIDDAMKLQFNNKKEVILNKNISNAKKNTKIRKAYDKNKK
jgi:hypothetical protein